MKKRWISLLLALMMVLTLLPLGALGADADNVKQYSHYVCIGDSIAAGYGAYARDVRGFTTVPEAYHSLVAEATGAEVQSLAHTGMRTVEVRWLLDDNYSASATANSLRAMYFNGLHDILYWMEMTKDDPNDPQLPTRRANITSAPTCASCSPPTAKRAATASSSFTAIRSRAPIS